MLVVVIQHTVNDDPRKLPDVQLCIQTVVLSAPLAVIWHHEPGNQWFYLCVDRLKVALYDRL